MSFLRVLVERYLGVPPGAPGEGTSWRVAFGSPGPDGWPAGLIAAAGMLLAAAVVTFYFRDAGRVGRGRAALLACLRLSALGLVAVMASRAAVIIDRTGLPVVAVLVDASASMGLPDGGTKSSPGGGSATRLGVARDVLTGGGGEFLRDLSRRFRIRVYRFDDEVVEVAAGEAAGVAGLVRQLDGLKPQGTGTRPAAAVRRVLEDLRGASPSAIVVLTDGVSTAGEGEALSAAASLAARNRVPLFPVGVGGGGPSADLDLYDVAVDEVGFVGDPVRVVGRFRAFGFAGGEVTLRLTDRATGKLIAEGRTTAPDDGRPAEAELNFVPEAEGDLDVTLSIRGAGRESDPSNNSATRRVRVRNEKVRVLLADRVPRYEFRFLKAALEREPAVDVDTVLQQADLGFSAEDRTALERFPIRKEEVLSYDVIVLGDLDPGLLGAESMEAVAEFVRERGGGLLAVAGPGFLPVRYAGTPLEPLLPVSLAEVSAPGGDVLIEEGFRPRPTLAGRQSGPLARVAGGGAGRVDWAEMPNLFWRADAPRLRPGAVALFEVPGVGGPPHPVIAYQRFGAGKVMLQLTDEIWRWRFRRGDSVYGRYWLQAIRHLSRGSTVGGERAVEITSDRRVYGQGQSVGLRVRFLDDRLVPGSGGVVVVLEDAAGGRQEVRLERAGALSEAFEARIDLLPRGSYHAWVREPAFSGAPPSADFRVEAPDLELRLRAADLADLRRAAEVSGGRFSTPREAGRLPERLPAGRPVRLESSEPRPLWNRPELVLAFAVALAAEWWLRKRMRLP